MKTYLAIALAAVGLAMLVFGGGCVAKSKLDEAQALCRRANDELQDCRQQLRAAKADNESLAASLADLQRTVKAKSDEIALLEAKNSDLQAAFSKLKALHEEAMMSKPPLPVGDIILLPTQVDAALRNWANEKSELVDYLPRYGMVKFKADFTFEKGSDNVSGEAVEALGKLTEILNSPAAEKFHVYVAGHTDDIPILKPATRRRHPTNWYLSVHRAVEVEKVLVKAGLAPGRIGVMGFGEYHPIAPNRPGKKGNAKNRRVEIWIVPPGRFLTAEAPSGGK